METTPILDATLARIKVKGGPQLKVKLSLPVPVLDDIRAKLAQQIEDGTLTKETLEQELNALPTDDLVLSREDMQERVVEGLVFQFGARFVKIVGGVNIS